MKRLEVKEHNSYNFTTVMKGEFQILVFYLLSLCFRLHVIYVTEYKSVHDSFQTSDYYAKNVCLRVWICSLLKLNL